MCVQTCLTYQVKGNNSGVFEYYGFLVFRPLNIIHLESGIVFFIRLFLFQ